MPSIVGWTAGSQTDGGTRRGEHTREAPVPDGREAPAHSAPAAGSWGIHTVGSQALVAEAGAGSSSCCVAGAVDVAHVVSMQWSVEETAS